MTVRLTVYNYTGKDIYAAATSSSHSSDTWKSGKITPTASTPSTFSLNGNYDVFSFGNYQYYGQASSDFLISQYGSTSGYDPNNITIAVGLAPSTLKDASGDTVEVPSGAYSLYLKRYSSTLIDNVKDMVKSGLEYPVSSISSFSMKNVLLIILAIIILAVIVGVVYYYYKKHKTG